MEFNKSDGTVKLVGSRVQVCKQTRRTGLFRRDIPRTEEHRKRSRKSKQFDWFYVWTNKRILESSGNIVARYWQEVVLQGLLRSLMASTIVLKENYKPPKGKQTRAEQWVYHIGVWCKYVKYPKTTAQTKNEYVQAWLEANKRLFKFLSALFEREFPRVFRQYRQVMEEFSNLPNYFGAWSTCALNINFASKYHQDSKDFRNGFCWVLPFGNFTEGGELLFDDMKLAFRMQNGSLIAFRSYDVFHSVRKYTGGYRNSLVLFTHHQMMMKGMKQYDRRKKRESRN